MVTTRKNRHTPPPDDGVTLTQAEFDELTAEANASRQLALPPPEDEEETAIDRVAALLSGLRDQPDERAVLKLYKVIGPNKYAWANDYKTEEFEAGGMNMIREQWGPGEYQVRLYATHPDTGRFVIRAKENITVMAPLVSLPNSSAQPAGANDTVMRALIDGQNKMLERLSSAPPVDPKAQMREMLEMMTLMKGVFGGGGGNQRNSLADQLAELRALKELAADLVDGEKTPAEPSIMALAGDVLKMVSGAAAQQPQRTRVPNPAPPVRLVAPVPAAQSARPETPAEPAAETGENQVSAFDLILMKKTLTKVVRAAAEKAEPEEGADILANAIDDLDDKDAAFAMLTNERWFEVLQMIAPEVKEHQEWLTKVRDATLVLFPVDGDDALDDSGEGSGSDSTGPAAA